MVVHHLSRRMEYLGKMEKHSHGVNAFGIFYEGFTEKVWGLRTNWLADSSSCLGDFMDLGAL